MKRATTLVLNMLAYTNGLPLITVLLLLGITCVSAKVISVPSSGRKLRKVLYSAQQGDTLLLEPGTYTGEFLLPPLVTLKSKELHKAVINGANAKVAVTLTNGNILDGITVRGSRIGVFSEGLNNAIVNCQIMNNLQSGIMAIGETPTIEDNIIARNSGSGIQLYAVNKNAGTIDHNTIVYNLNHGISIGGKSEVEITNNIVAFNHRYTIKTLGDSVTTFQQYNNYYYNIEINLLLPKGNYSYDPQFIKPEKNNFELEENSPAHFDGEEGSTLGTRIYQNNNN